MFLIRIKKTHERKQLFYNYKCPTLSALATNKYYTAPFSSIMPELDLDKRQDVTWISSKAWDMNLLLQAGTLSSDLLDLKILGFSQTSIITISQFLLISFNVIAI